MDGHRYCCQKYTKKGIHLNLVQKNGGSGGGGGGRDEGGKDEGKGLSCTSVDIPRQDVDICFCSLLAAQKANDDAANSEKKDANSEKTPASKKPVDEKKDDDETPVEDDTDRKSVV